MITNLLSEMGGVIAQKRESLWATRSFTATKDDVAFGCVIGKTYTLWVAQKEGKTQSGNPVAKGDWFCVEAQ